MKWIDEFIQLLFPVNGESIRIHEAMSLKKKNIPNKLFKYTCFSDTGSDLLKVSNIRQHALWCSKAKNLNDPFECAANVIDMNYFVNDVKQKFLEEYEGKNIFSAEEISEIQNAVSIAKIMEIVTPKSNGFQQIPVEKRASFYTLIENFIYKQNTAFHQKAMSAVYICSLSERIDSSPMWAHYANNHKGFAIEYDFINDCPLTCQNPLYPVVYADDIPDLSAYFSPKNGDDFNNLIASYQAMIKNRDWSYEKEWRIIIQLGDNNEAGINIKGPKIKAIYGGINISERDKNWLLQICQESGLEMYQMVQPNHSFLLTYEKIK